VESGCDEILDDAVEHDVSFLVVGDVFAYVYLSFDQVRVVQP
jgi:diphthamide biosynthesis methyltransferase